MPAGPGRPRPGRDQRRGCRPPPRPQGHQARHRQALARRRAHIPEDHRPRRDPGAPVDDGRYQHVRPSPRRRRKGPGRRRDRMGGHRDPGRRQLDARGQFPVDRMLRPLQSDPQEGRGRHLGGEGRQGGPAHSGVRRPGRLHECPLRDRPRPQAPPFGAGRIPLRIGHRLRGVQPHARLVRHEFGPVGRRRRRRGP